MALLDLKLVKVILPGFPETVHPNESTSNDCLFM